jgi:hypothetical protein
MGVGNLFKVLLVSLLINVLPSFAMQQETEHPEQEKAPPLGKPNPEDLKHGAVLCSWSIFLIVRTIGNTCYAPKDEEFRNTLDREIARIDKFIMDNRPATPEELEILRQGLAFMPPDYLCSDQSRQFYEVFRNWGREKIRQGVTDLLSVPRKPAMNPCL